MLNKNTLVYYALVILFFNYASIYAMNLEIIINSTNPRQTIETLQQNRSQIEDSILQTKTLLQDQSTKQNEVHLLTNYQNLLKTYLPILEELAPFDKKEDTIDTITSLIQSTKDTLTLNTNRIKILKLASKLNDDLIWVNRLHTITEALRTDPHSNGLDTILKNMTPEGKIESLHKSKTLNENKTLKDMWQKDCEYLSKKYPQFSIVTKNMEELHTLKRKIDKQKDLEQKITELTEKSKAEEKKHLKEIQYLKSNIECMRIVTAQERKFHKQELLKNG